MFNHLVQPPAVLKQKFNKEATTYIYTRYYRDAGTEIDVGPEIDFGSRDIQVAVSISERNGGFGLGFRGIQGVKTTSTLYLMYVQNAWRPP